MTLSHNHKVYFLVALLVYLTTRLVCLPDYPNYFFCDEAVLTIRAEELIERKFRDGEGRLFPAYFTTGQAYNTSLAVYLQMPGYLLFGKSIWVNRGTIAIISFFGAIGVALIARDFLRCRNYWLVPFFLALMPSWFLHSRTSFDPALMVSIYPWFLYFYLRYMQQGGLNLVWTIIFGSATFYSYSAGQALMFFSGLFLALSDWRYHLKHLRQSLLAVPLLLICASPYLRFRWHNQEALNNQLNLLDSYWTEYLPLTDKVIRFLKEWAYGLDPRFWFTPNQEIINRHQMPDYAHLMIWSAPLLYIGVYFLLKRYRESTARAVLIAMIASPIGAAFVDTTIVRAMAFIVPASLCMAICADKLLEFLDLRKHPNIASLAVTALLSFASFKLLLTTLVPSSYSSINYGITGLQWGAKQLYSKAIPDYLKKFNPPAVYVSSVWANGGDSLLSFYDLDPRVEMVDIGLFNDYYRPFTNQSTFVLTKNQYQALKKSNKFKPFSPDQFLHYPDGEISFVILRLSYVTDVKEKFLDDKIARARLIQTILPLVGQQAKISHSAVDMGSVKELFDGDKKGLVRGESSNPFVVEIEFPSPQTITSIKCTFRPDNFEITLLTYKPNSAIPLKFTTQYKSGSGEPPEAYFDLKAAVYQRIRLEIYDTHSTDLSCIHLYEIEIKP